MVYLLEEVLEDGIIATIDEFVAHGIGKDSSEAITTDDLIPIIAYVISQSSYKYYHSTLYYIENFIFTDITTTKLAFILINFRAAIMYICEQPDDGQTQLAPISSSRSTSLALLKQDLTRSSSTPLDTSTEQPLSERSGTLTTPQNVPIGSPISVSKVSPSNSMKVINLPKSSPKQVTQPLTPQNKSNFQRAPEVILVNHSPQEDCLSYLKSLPKQ